VTTTLHEGERKAFMQLAEYTGRAPSDMLRFLIRYACQAARIVVDAPPVDPRPGAFPPPPLPNYKNHRRHAKRKVAHIAEVAELDYTIVGEKVRAVLKPRPKPDAGGEGE